METDSPGTVFVPPRWFALSNDGAFPSYPGEPTPAMLTNAYYQLIWMVNVLIWLFIKIRAYGSNSIVVDARLKQIKDSWQSLPLSQWAISYKSIIKYFNKREFNEFRLRGIIEMRRNQTIASRGFMKIQDIHNQTGRLFFGRILNLCCGAGGWEQYLANQPDVLSIESYTYGPSPDHPGHEKFTDLPFAGREKVSLHYGDARNVMPSGHDWILFDGGESDPNYIKEEERFYNLLVDTTKKHVTPTSNFVWKILTPTSPRVLEYLKWVQDTTGEGSFWRSTQSRTSTLELYFVSTQITNLERSARNLLQSVLTRAEASMGERSQTSERVAFAWPPLPDIGIPDLPPPDYSQSIKHLGPQVAESGRHYKHWKTKGVYPFGSTGTINQPHMRITPQITGALREILPEFASWKLTDTTPKGFFRVFTKKVDTTPVEDHSYLPYMKSMYHELAGKIPMDYRPLKNSELYEYANKKGAPGVSDNVKSVKEFFQLPDWEAIIEMTEASLIHGTPIHSVWSTMGKREKKKSPGPVLGSRMIAYLPIATRMVELKYFHAFLDLTKPANNPTGVGSVGLHDYGERLKTLWKEAGLSDDIAGWDTRVSTTMLKLEHWFLQHYIKDPKASAVVRAIYRVYAHPLILIPMESNYVRSELLQGRGQRMSGSPY